MSSDKSSIDPYREHLVRSAEFAREKLAKDARHIERRMGALATQLERGDSIVNELGELQGQGPMLDACCAAYALARRAVEEYDSFGAGPNA